MLLTYTRRVWLPATIIALTLSSTAAEARRAKAEAVKMLDDLQNCRLVTEPAKRLACYDQGIDALKEARNQDKHFLADSEKAKFEPINSTAVSVAELEPGTWLLVLADHSVWRTEDDVRFIPKVGQPVHVVKASLGSFMANVGKEIAVRVRQLR